MRVFLDTNVLASATATRGLCADVLRVTFEFHQLVVCDLLLNELERVLREKFRASPELIAETLWLLRQDSVTASPLPHLVLPIKDQDDIPIVSSAVNGQAVIFVTGDQELLTIKRVDNTEILSPRAFWEKLKNGTT